MGYNPPRRQRVGNLRHRITWQELTLIPGPLNDIEEWVDRETEPARVEPLKGNEQFSGDETIARQNLRVFTRYRHVSDTAKWRLLWITGHMIGDVPERLILDILAVSNPDERQRFVELLCQNTNSQADEPYP